MPNDDVSPSVTVPSIAIGEVPEEWVTYLANRRPEDRLAVILQELYPMIAEHAIKAVTQEQDYPRRIDDEALAALDRLWGDDPRRGGFIGPVDIPVDLFVKWYTETERQHMIDQLIPVLFNRRKAELSAKLGMDVPGEPIHMRVLLDDGMLTLSLGEIDIDTRTTDRDKYNQLILLVKDVAADITIERDRECPR